MKVCLFKHFIDMYFQINKNSISQKTPRGIEYNASDILLLLFELFNMKITLITIKCGVNFKILLIKVSLKYSFKNVINIIKINEENPAIMVFIKKKLLDILESKFLT